MTQNIQKPVGRPKGTGTQRVYSKVRKNILRLRIAPGTDLDEASLEREFGVSRTPVREALIRLASEGLISLLPNRGARVTPIDVSDVSQIFEALELAHRAANRWCAVRRKPEDVEKFRKLSAAFAEAARESDYERMGEVNNEFHAAIGGACGNKYLARFYDTQLAISLRLGRMVFADSPHGQKEQDAYYDELIRQHEAIVEAIEAGDADAADQLARDHVALFRSRVVAYIERSLAGEVSPPL